MSFLTNKYLQIGTLAVVLVGFVIMMNQQITQQRFDVPPIPVLPGQSPLVGQVPDNFNVFLAADAEGGATVPADDHNFIVVGGTGDDFGLLVGALSTDDVKRFWMYEYTGSETHTSFPGRFYISAGEFAAQDAFTQSTYSNLLDTNGEIDLFVHGKTYYVMAEMDTYFKTDIGLSFSTPIAECGNSSLESGEACDDGNETAEDGCSDTCQVEDGWECDDQEPSACTFVCGNGTLQIETEECDNGGLCDDGVTVERHAHQGKEMAAALHARWNTALSASPVQMGRRRASATHRVEMGSWRAWKSVTMEECAMTAPLYVIRAMTAHPEKYARHGKVMAAMRSAWKKTAGNVTIRNPAPVPLFFRHCLLYSHLNNRQCQMAP